MNTRFTQLSIAVIALSFANGAFAAWQEIGQNEQTVVLVDTATLKIEGDKAQMMSMLSFKKRARIQRLVNL